MKRILLFIICCLMSTCVVFSNRTARAEGGSPIGLTAGVEYWGNYFWRGLDFFGNDGVFFPYVYFSPGNSGLSLMYMGQYASETLGDGTGKTDPAPGTGLNAYQGAHFNLAYKLTIANAVTIGASAWYYWFYKSEDELGYDQSWAEGTVSLSINALPLCPTISYTHDYYVDENATVNGNGVRGEGEQGRDYYVKFALSHSFQLVSGSTLALGASAGYFNYESNRKKGFSDIVASAKLATSAGPVSLFGQMNFAYVPDDDFNSEGDNEYRWWANFGVAFSI